MSAQNQSDTDVGEPFEVTLARGLGMARNPLPIQTILTEHRRKLVKLNRGRRQKLAAELQQEYCRRSARIEGNKCALQTLNEQYTNVQYFVTRIHRLPVEILMKIFYIILDDDPSAVVLMLVCRRWHNAIEAMPGVQTSLELHTWTAPEIIRRATSGFASRLLNITVDTDQDDDLKGLSIKRYSTIAIAMESAAQWRSLTVHSLPRSGQLDDSALHKILSTNIPPMMRLEELRIISAVDPSPLIDRLLQCIIPAKSGLTTIETNCLYSSQFLLRVTSTDIFHSLTTLKAVLPKVSEPIDILPRFIRLEVLEVTNLSLPPYQNESPLPFIRTLRHLYLKSVTVDWMAGRIFPFLTLCTIITPPRAFLALDVHLPTCREPHFSHWCTASFGRFQGPIVNSLVIHSNHWTPFQGSQVLVDMCMAGLGTVLRPRVLHLSMLCNGSVLLAALRDLPALEELHLKLPTPSALGRGFFTSLLAKPVNIPYGRELHWFEWAENQNDWRTAICPSLKVFNLHYQRWLRPNEQIGFVAPLLALGWSRKKAEMLLQTLCVHMKANNGNWKRVELVSVRPKHLLELDISQLQYLRLEQDPLQFVFQAYLTSATLSVIEGQRESIPHLTEAVFGTSFHRIRVLDIRWREKYRLNVLHCFQHLEVLLLDGIQVSLYPHGVDLPLLQTLRRLSISGGSGEWLDGHTFAQLSWFRVRHLSSWRNSFPKRVDMPICAHISYDTYSLEFLLIFQAGFRFPLTCEWTLVGPVLAQDSPVAWLHALNKVHTRVLRLSINIETPQLVMVIQPIYELEELSIVLYSRAIAKTFLIALTDITVDYSLTNTTNTSFDTQTITKLQDTIDHTFNPPKGTAMCPNLKVLGLGLQFFDIEKEDENKVRQWCVKMMKCRRQAGFPLDRCCIWWRRYHIDWQTEPSLVLFDHFK